MVMPSMAMSNAGAEASSDSWKYDAWGKPIATTGSLMWTITS